MTEKESTNNIRRPSTFLEKQNDPGFLAAKGRFYVEQERDLQQLIKSGVTTDDPQIIVLKNSIDEQRKNMENNHVKHLANAIIKSIENNGYASIRFVGRNAAYNALKAATVANDNFRKHSDGQLYFTTSFEVGNIGSLRNRNHVENVTAIVLHAKILKQNNE